MHTWTNQIYGFNISADMACAMNQQYSYVRTTRVYGMLLFIFNDRVKQVQAMYSISDKNELKALSPKFHITSLKHRRMRQGHTYCKHNFLIFKKDNDQTLFSWSIFIFFHQLRGSEGF